MDNIVQLKATPEAEPTYHYSIRLKDGTEREAVGYLLLNSVFVGVAQGEGILQCAFPTSEFVEVVNHGPITGGLNN